MRCCVQKFRKLNNVISALGRGPGILHAKSKASSAAGKPHTSRWVGARTSIDLAIEVAADTAARLAPSKATVDIFYRTAAHPRSRQQSTAEPPDETVALRRAQLSTVGKAVRVGAEEHKDGVRRGGRAGRIMLSVEDVTAMLVGTGVVVVSNSDDDDSAEKDVIFVAHPAPALPAAVTTRRKYGHFDGEDRRHKSDKKVRTRAVLVCVGASRPHDRFDRTSALRRRPSSQNNWDWLTANSPARVPSAAGSERPSRHNPHRRARLICVSMRLPCSCRHRRQWRPSHFTARYPQKSTQSEKRARMRSGSSQR